ncbi:MAG TPA: hypothetical protein VMD58_02375 [Acidobacteriaceae bacterium]|nr:hypothetical protein [Acidobacteriaceae bacterium]
MAALRALAEEKGRAFRRELVGRTLSVVTLEGGDTERTPAMTANFQKVDVAGRLPVNRMEDVRLSARGDQGDLAGRAVRAM